MPSWKSLLGAIMLVLMLWTGGLAQAAERVDCIPTTAEAAGHYDGDGDQLPSERERGLAHHHSGCSGHQLAASNEQPTTNVHHLSATVPLPKRTDALHGHDPDRQLRPPIA